MQNINVKRCIGIFLAVICVFIGSLNTYAYNILFEQKSGEPCIYTKGIRKGQPLTIYAIAGTPDTYVQALKIGIDTWNSAGFGELLRYGGIRNYALTVEKDGISTFGVYDFITNRPDLPSAIANANQDWDSEYYLTETDIRITNIETFFSILEENKEDKFDIIGVVVHELGHSVGLQNSYDTTAVMWRALATGDSSKRVLKQDDINGLKFLYGEEYAKPPSDEATKPLLPDENPNSSEDSNSSGNNFEEGDDLVEE